TSRLRRGLGRPALGPARWIVPARRRRAPGARACGAAGRTPGRAVWGPDMTAPSSLRLYRPAEVAEILGVTARHVTTLCQLGRLQGTNVGTGHAKARWRITE